MRVGNGIDLLGTITRVVPERNPPASDRSRLRTFLIIKLSSIGDVAHDLPVASALRQRFPSARISWVAEEWTAPLVIGHPVVDRVIVCPTMVRWPAPTGLWLRQLRGAIRELRSERYDVALDLQGLARRAAVAALSRASLRIARAGQREGSHLVSYGVPLLSDRRTPWTSICTSRRALARVRSTSPSICRLGRRRATASLLCSPLMASTQT